MIFFRSFFLGACLAVILGLSLIFVPVSHAFFLGGVSLKDEKEMGKRFDALVRSHMSVMDDPEVRKYAEDLLKRLTRAIPLQPFNFKASVLLHNSLNAFAVPGGYVFIFTGLIMNLDNEAELAGVLAHELAHVTQRHVASRMERAQFLTIGALLAGVAGIALAGPAGAAAAMTAAGASQSAMLSYSRIDENEADNIGMQYLMGAGYPPSGMVGSFRLLRQKNYLSGINVPTYLSTHPAIGDRLNNLGARIKALPENKRKGTFDNSRFKRVQTLLWARYGDEQAALHRFSGNDALSLMGRGIVYSRQNRVREAATAFDQALKASPDDPLVMREAGIFHFRKGDMGRAGNLLAKAMAKDPRDYMASFFYGRMLEESGHRKDATRHYKDVLRYVPEDPEVHEAMGRALGRSGDRYEGYIHLAYSALYGNKRKLADRYFREAKDMSAKARDKRSFQKLEAVYKERKDIWDKS